MPLAASIDLVTVLEVLGVIALIFLIIFLFRRS